MYFIHDNAHFYSKVTLKKNPYLQALGWVIELLPIGIVVCVSLWYVLKKLCQGEDIRFLEPGPMMTPKYSWGPRADSGLVKQDQGLENHGYAP